MIKKTGDIYGLFDSIPYLYLLILQNGDAVMKKKQKYFIPFPISS